MEEEIWKIWKDTRNPHRGGHGHLYEVSNLGNVKINGKLYDYSYQTYKYYRLPCKDTIHRAVATLFVPNPENKPCVDHINGNRYDNRACNLRWVTYKENVNNPITRKKVLEFHSDEEYSRKMSISMCKRTFVIKDNEVHFIKTDELQTYLNNGFTTDFGTCKNKHREYINETHTKYHYVPNN